jgi:hypothetical protein
VPKDIAEVGGGSYRRASLGGVTLRDPREVRISRHHHLGVWSSPAWLLLAVGLVAAAWVAGGAPDMPDRSSGSADARGRLRPTRARLTLRAWQGR